MRILPLFFYLQSLPDLIRDVITASEGGSKIEPFPMDVGHRMLNEAREAKKDRDAMVKIGEMMMTQQEWNNNNIMKLRNKFDRHSFGNKVCFMVLTFVMAVNLTGIVYIVSRWMGA